MKCIHEVSITRTIFNLASPQKHVKKKNKNCIN